MMLYSLSNIILSVIGGIYGLGAIASGTAELNSGLFGTANEINSAMNASFIPMMMLALPIAILPAPDTVIPHFSLQHHEDPNLAMDSLIRWLHASPVLEGKIMTAKDTLKVYKPYAKDKKKIIAIYAYSKMQQAFVAYDTFNDILVKNNFTP